MAASGSAPRPSAGDLISRARIDESLGRSAPTWHHPAPADAVRAHGDALTHAAYRTARRTLCGKIVVRGQPDGPGCTTCGLTLDDLAARGLVGASGTPARCGATTRRGTPCQRAPLEGGYCPSHQHLAEP